MAPRRPAAYLYLTVAIAPLIAGYAVFFWFVTNVMGGAVALGLSSLAIMAGVASFFSPCSFPLLLAYIGQSEIQTNKNIAPPRAMTSGFHAALGVTAFNLILGSLLGVAGFAIGSTFSISGEQPNVAVLVLRGLAGGLLVLLGVSHLTRYGIDFHGVQHRIAGITQGLTESTGPNLFAYGFFYTLLGIGCGGPILAGLAIAALASGGFSSAIIAFGMYAATMAFLMILVATAIALSGDRLLLALRLSTQTIRKVSGLVLVVVGLFLVFSAVFFENYLEIFFP